MIIDPINAWIEALRSGNFKQGKSALKTSSDSFCCLGVLCELAVAEGIIPPDNGGYYGVGNSATEAILPDEVARWANIENNPCFRPAEIRHESQRWGNQLPTQMRVSLSELNDEFDFTFDMIADVIEDNLIVR